MISGDLERLRHALKPAFLWDVGRRRLVWANAAAVRYFGARSLAELVERPFDAREAGVRALNEAARAIAAAAGDDDAAHERRVELLFPSAGRDEPLCAVVRPHLLADGRPGLLVVAEEAGAARLAPPAMLSGILDEMPQAVVALDPSGALVYANPAALELMDESALAALSGIFPTRSAALDFLARVREAGTAVITREAQTAIGRRTLRLVARVAHERDLVIVMLDDLTDRLAAERMELPLIASMPEMPVAEAEREATTPPAAEKTSTALRPDELEALRRLVEELSPQPEEEEDRNAPARGAQKADAFASPATLNAAAPAEKIIPEAPDRKGASAAPGSERATAPVATPPEKSARITIRVKPAAEAPAAAPATDGPEAPSAGKGERAEEMPPAETVEEAATSRVSVRIAGTPRPEAEAGAEVEAEAPRPDEEEAGASEAREEADATTAEETVGAADAALVEVEPEPEPRRPAAPVTEGRGETPAPDAEEATAERSEGPQTGELREDAETRESTEEPEAAKSGEGAERPAAPERPEPPSLVREVLDHRPEPIILHRADAFYFANHAARELFGFAPEDPAWDDIARALAAAVEGEDVLLPDTAGTSHRFRLKRDVFPWRAGVVVQSTLLPAETDLAETPGAPPPGSAVAASAGGDVAAGLEKLREQVKAVASRAPAPVIRIHAHPRRHHGGSAAGKDIGRNNETSGPGAGRPPVASAPLAESLAGAAPATPEAATPAEAPPQRREQVDDDVLGAVLEAASEGVITLNERGEILSFSAGAADLFGISAAAALGRPLASLLEEGSRPALQSRLEALREGAADRAHARDRGREVNARRPDGEQITLFMTIGMLERRRPVADDHTARFCVLVRDITPFKRRERELVAAREEAERQSARKSEFLARISHELRTPLNAILGFSDVLRQELFGKLGNEKYLDYARDIHESGEHLLSLVNDLLDLARIEAGRFQVQFTEVDLPEVVQEATRLLRDQAQEAEIDLRVVIPEELPKVVADARSVKQILLNLLSNAIKYGREGGRVVVALRQLPEGGLELSVKDDGPGMSDDELRQALEPFSRVERTGEGKPGTGLGLPLAKALAEANKARFEVKSAPGEGTAARVVFPPHRVLA